MQNDAREGNVIAVKEQLSTKSASGSTSSHKGASNGESTTKGNGDGEAWIWSYNEEKTHNTRQSYTSKKRY